MRDRIVSGKFTNNNVGWVTLLPTLSYCEVLSPTKGGSMTRIANSFEEILERYELKYAATDFLNWENIPKVESPDWFREELRFSLTHRGTNDQEAYVAEFIIVPFLKEIWKRHPDLNLFSHVSISADEITVVPDYLLSAKTPTGYKTLSKPLLLTVEAKNEKFDEGWSQALLQSVVCQKINGNPDIPILSIVTTGDTWQFGNLKQNLFTKNPIPASIQHVDELLGILDCIFSKCDMVSGKDVGISG